MATTGQTVTKTLRKVLHIGARTRRYRDGEDLYARMLEAVTLAATLPGYWLPATQEALRPGFMAACAHNKHVQGGRVTGALVHHITTLSPWAFAAYLGEMVDAGITNVGQAEIWYSEKARTIVS
jgi:hypothetical protein